MSTLPVLRGAGANEFHAELARVSASPRTSVLIRAPRGTPLDAVATAIHRCSQRAAFEFVGVRCAELTPASVARAFAAAGRGTLLLDEIALLSLEVQTELARALGLREIAGTPIEARVLAATALDPEQLVARGALREDLLYRLNGLALALPTLSARRAAIVTLAREQLARVAPLHRVREQGFTRAAEQRLADHAWPGNDRELELVVERALLRAGDGPIDVVQLALGETPPRARESAPDSISPALVDRSLAAVEEALIRRVMHDEHGNKSRCARVLGLHRATLHSKLKTYRIES